MMKLHLVRSSLARVRRAETLIVSEMAAGGIPDPAAIIHSLIEADDLVEVTLYSSAKVFACGVARLRRRDRVTVVYGVQVTEAIAMAAKFVGRVN
jgi:hypothetical protein